MLALPLDNAIAGSFFLSCGIFQIVKCVSESYSFGKFYEFQFHFLDNLKFNYPIITKGH